MKRQPSRLVLGRVGIAPGIGSQRIDSVASLARRSARGDDDALAMMLAEILSSIPTLQGPGQTAEMALDAELLEFRFGGAIDLSLGTVGLPLWWRPRVCLQGRVYSLESKETRTVLRTTRRRSWPLFLCRILSWRVLLGLDSPASVADVRRLLEKAGAALVARAIRAL